ncbi:hypothetical protein ABE236_18070 [Priestia endophytica]|uniref:hypothetical protein n=1 Tax=Priestia endophytica TaxID=135735 RepID=UPI003D28E736
MSIFADETVHEFTYQGFKFGALELSYGASNQINKKAMQINMVTQKPEIDLAVLQEEKLKAALSYIKDPQGNDIVVTLDVIRKLKSDVAGKVIEFIDSINEVTEEEKKN